MFNSKPAIRQKRNRHRMLRSESLERRALLSVVPMASAGEFVPPEEEQVAAEEGKLMEATIDFAVDYKTPVDEIYIPETLDGFPLGNNPGDFERMPDSEQGLTTPLPEGVDPSKLPGEGCPAGQEPCTPEPGVDDVCSDTWFEWWAANAESDVSCPEGGSWDDAATDKVSGWGSPAGHPLIQTCEAYEDGGSDGKSGSDTGGKVDSGKAEDDIVDFTEKEAGLDDEVSKDPEPEGDDPEEQDGGLVDHAFAMYDPSVASATDPDANNLPRTGERDAGEDDPWARHRAKVSGRGIIDPEGDGGPDELTSPTAASLVDAAIIGDFARYPTPDDTDGPTDPRASVGELGTMMSDGPTASPPVDSDGKNPIPIGPEFSPLMAAGAF